MNQIDADKLIAPFVSIAIALVGVFAGVGAWLIRLERRLNAHEALAPQITQILADIKIRHEEQEERNEKQANFRHDMRDSMQNLMVQMAVINVKQDAVKVEMANQQLKIERNLDDRERKLEKALDLHRSNGK